MKKVKFALASLALAMMFVALPQTSSAVDGKDIAPEPLSVVKPFGFTIVIED